MPIEVPASEPGETVEASDAVQLPNAAETLDYLIALTVQLRRMAQKAGLDRLGLILMMAEQEGRQQLASVSGPSGENGGTETVR